MEKHPENLDSFRRDLRDAMVRAACGQIDLMRDYGVNQSIISNFLSGRRGISADSMLKLWPFVYGRIEAGPAIPTTPPAGDESEEGGESA